MKRIITFLLILLLLITGCSNRQIQYTVRPQTKSSVETFNALLSNLDVNESFEEVDIEHDIQEVTLTAVGDIMFHIWQLRRAYDSETDSFDFSNTFQYIRPYLEDSDFVIGNLETTLAGKDNGIKIRDGNYFMGYQGYPCFNTPQVLANNLKEVGFDLVSTANNHSLDSHPEGVKTTLDILDDTGIKHVGTYRNQKDSEEVLTTSINNISFAFVNYTYGTNGFTVPDSEPYLVNTIDMYNESKIDEMKQNVRNADETKADFVVVMMHFGNEYFDFPNSYQKDIVDELFEAGADIILGSHPHVLQPIEIRDIQQSDGTSKKGIVIYSLGNFISSQRFSKKNPSNTDIGVVMNIHFKKIDDHTPQITGLSLIPTGTYWSEKEISVLPVDEVLDNLGDMNIVLDDYELNRLNYSNTHTINHLLSYTDGEYDYKDYRYYIHIK